MSHIIRVTVGTTPTLLYDFDGGGVVTCLIQCPSEIRVGLVDTFSWASGGWTIKADTPFGIQPPPGDSKLYAVVQAGTADVEVWAMGPGV